MVGPGTAFVFTNTEAEQRFSAGRYRHKGLAQRLLVTRAPKPAKVLDPVIEYFDSIRLTYGFASVELTRNIRRGIAPELDQHAACEHRPRGAFVCNRGGAACDFLVEDEDMRDVVE